MKTTYMTEIVDQKAWIKKRQALARQLMLEQEESQEITCPQALSMSTKKQY
jgi:hypothetical protein